jgi:hypothetical protein
MKSLFALFVLLLTGPASAQVVVIGIDGLSTAGLLRVHTPHLDGLMETGASTLHARTVLPTVSSPNWASMLMGAGPEQHGITSNGWERATATLQPTTAGTSGYFPTIFRLLREQRPTAYIAAIYEWGGFVRLFEPEVVDHSLDALSTQHVVDEAVALFHQQRPTLTFLHLDLVDLAGHASGWTSAAYDAAVAEADRLVGVLRQGLTDAGMDATVIVVSDHGGIGRGHGGETMDEVEVPWIIQGPAIKKGTTIEPPFTVFDTAPTIASLLGLTPPRAWTGRALDTEYRTATSPTTVAPASFAWHDAAFEVFPNPASGTFTLRYHLPLPASVRLAVYDARGRQVAVLVDAVRTAGEHTVRWAGTDTGGQPVAAGTYHCRLSTDTGVHKSLGLVVTRPRP